MYGIRNPEELDEPVVREFESLVSTLKAFLLQEHNEDGTHRFGEANELESSLTPTIQAIMQRAQDRGQWWIKGPWRLDDPTAGSKDNVILRPPQLATGTYHDYAPEGIDTAVGIEIEPSGGDVTLTGIKIISGSPTFKRLFILRNRDSTNSVHLLHDNAGSIEENRFNLPSGVDIEVGPGEMWWGYYDPGRTAWTSAITPNTSGGLGLIADNSITNAKLRDSGALSVIGRSANSSGDPADISASATSDSVLRESGSVLGFGTIATAGIANDAVTYAKMQNISATQRLLGRNTSGAGDTEEVTITQALDWLGE